MNAASGSESGGLRDGFTVGGGPFVCTGVSGLPVNAGHYWEVEDRRCCRGRDRERVTSRSASNAATVLLFIEVPRSEWTTSGTPWVLKTCSGGRATNSSLLSTARTCTHSAMLNLLAGSGRDGAVTGGGFMSARRRLSTVELFSPVNSAACLAATPQLASPANVVVNASSAVRLPTFSPGALTARTPASAGSAKWVPWTHPPRSRLKMKSSSGHLVTRTTPAMC